MELPTKIFWSEQKMTSLLKESLELEHRRRQLSIDVSKMIEEVEKYKKRETRLLSDWLNELLSDLTHGKRGFHY